MVEGMKKKLVNLSVMKIFAQKSMFSPTDVNKLIFQYFM